ncbi:MAG TPA: hypothetical protein VFN96_00060 [Gemmatimonadales bacterium]|nr:hypothetical protein [Gemmatimonadales bacterium]
MNRLKTREEEQRDPEGAGAWFYLSCRSGGWYLSTAMAKHVEACLDAEPRPCWIRFVDNTGSAVRVRTRDVDYLEQSTPEQRAQSRAFSRAVKSEQKADRNWEEDD